MTNYSRKELKINFLRNNEELAKKALSKLYSPSCPNITLLIGDIKRTGIYGNLTPPHQIHAGLVLIAKNDIGWNLLTKSGLNENK